MESKYKPEYCELLIEHMAGGFSFDSFGAKVRCGGRTLYDWLVKHEDFNTAYTMAKHEALEFYEKHLVAKVTGKKLKELDADGNEKELNGDITTLIFAMKTRFHKTYGEKQTTTHEVGKQTIEDFLSNQENNH